MSVLFFRGSGQISSSLESQGYPRPRVYKRQKVGRSNLDHPKKLIFKIKICNCRFCLEIEVDQISQLENHSRYEKNKNRRSKLMINYATFLLVCHLGKFLKSASSVLLTWPRQPVYRVRVFNPELQI